MNGTSNHQRIELIKILLLSILLNKEKSDKKFDVTKTKTTAKTVQHKYNFVSLIKVLLGENIVHKFIRVNEFEGTTYFNKERFEEFIKWILLFELIQTDLPTIEKKDSKKKITKTEAEKELLNSSKNNFEKYIELIDKAEFIGYDFIKFQSGLDKIPDDKLKEKRPINKRKKK
jgi:hypothetical protein